MNREDFSRLRSHGVSRSGPLPVWQRWFPFVGHPSTSAPARLLCLPHAGGGASLFHSWPRRLAPIEVFAAALPGREQRISEEPIRRIEQLVDEIHTAIRPHLDRPYAIFGHSMGALVGFELVRAVERAGERPPVRLFASGRPAPSSKSSLDIHQLPRPALLAALKALGKGYESAFAHEGLVDLVLPAIRCDLALCASYLAPARAAVATPITALAGSRDPAAPEHEVDRWREVTTSTFERHTFKGDHFFIRDAEPDLFHLIKAALLSS